MASKPVRRLWTSKRTPKRIANARNAAAGTMRQLASKNVADKPFDICFYDILRIEGPEFDSHWQALERFAEWGLKVDFE